MTWFKAGPLTDDKGSLSNMCEAKRCSAEKAVSHISSGDNVVIPLAAGEPTVLLRALPTRKAKLRDVRVHQMLPMGEHDYRKSNMERHFRHVSWMSNCTPRPGVQAGRAGLMFGYFHQYPAFLHNLGIDVFMGTVSTVDKHGFCSFGVSVDYTTTAARLAKKVLLVVNPHMPRTHGTSFIHVSQADCLVSDDTPLPEYHGSTGNDEEVRTIAALVAEHIPDKATIALGLGPIPQEVGAALHNRKGLGVHCDFLTDAIIDLIQCGAVTNRHKTLHPDKVICTSAIGSERLYRFLDDNPLVEMHSVSYTNDPTVIARNKHMTAVYTAGEVDLLGQAAPQSFGRGHLSSGGQVDFARGCAMAPEGRLFLVLKSRNIKNQSTIVPYLSSGTVVCVGRHDIDAVATEYGVAFLKGRTLRQRAEALIAVAHPEFRDGLEYAAKKMGLTR